MPRLSTLMLLCLPFPIVAATHCVDNAAALGIARDSAGVSAEADSIRIVRGSINVWTAEVAQIRGALTISGGWFPGCALRDATSSSMISGFATNAFVLRPMDADGNRSGNAGLDVNPSRAPGSQLIDNAAFDFFNRPARDHAGAARSSGARPEIGAYERTALQESSEQVPSRDSPLSQGAKKPQGDQLRC
ncbi:MAG: hypothetical protein SGI99_05755 [Pseudomonadota bacterium]|nr:hypothetical protein [Pseudomonadota bacterium]